jgi:hypothetical protein
MRSKDEMFAYWAAQQALIHQKRMEAGVATIRLVQGPEEPTLFSAEVQTEIRTIKQALQEQDVEVQAPWMVMDAVGGGGGYIGEFHILISQLTEPIVWIIVGAWLQSKLGRKIRIRIGDNEIEAPTKEALTVDEIYKLLRRVDDQTGVPPMETMDDVWITAAEALNLLKGPFGSAYEAQMTICKRAHSGMIRARAQRFVMDDRETSDDFEIPKEFWWAEGHSALHQNWTAGDFDTWTPNKQTHLQAFGVSFLRPDIEKLIPSGTHATPHLG